MSTAGSTTIFKMRIRLGFLMESCHLDTGENGRGDGIFQNPLTEDNSIVYTEPRN